MSSGMLNDWVVAEWVNWALSYEELYTIRAVQLGSVYVSENSVQVLWHLGYSLSNTFISLKQYLEKARAL